MDTLLYGSSIAMTKENNMKMPEKQVLLFKYIEALKECSPGVARASFEKMGFCSNIKEAAWYPI